MVDTPEAADSGAGDDGICSPPDADAGEVEGGGAAVGPGAGKGPGGVAVAAAVVEIVMVSIVYSKLCELTAFSYLFKLFQQFPKKMFSF